MTRRALVLAVVGVIVLAALAWGLSTALEYLVTPRVATIAGTDGAPDPAATAEDVAHITATLYFAAADGAALVPVRVEVPLAEGPVEQGRQILAQLLEPPPAPYGSVIPEGTTVRAFYVTDRGDAFVDLSAAVSTGHPGGSFAELLTVYAVVNSITANLPVIQRVQLLVEGREVDTLAGHVDLRRPLERDESLVRNEVQ